MSARERHTLRLRQQVMDKIRSLIDQKEFLCDLVGSYVTEAKSQAEQLLLTEDAGQFTDQYVDIMQQLDRCYKTCVVLAASAEDLIEGAGPKIPENQENTKTSEESPRPAFRECGPAPNQVMFSTTGSAAQSSFSVDILGSSDNSRPGGRLSSGTVFKQGLNGPDITSDGCTPGTSDIAKGDEIDVAFSSPVKRNKNRHSLSPFSKYETEMASSRYNSDKVDHKTDKRSITELSCSKHDKSVSVHDKSVSIHNKSVSIYDKSVSKHSQCQSDQDLSLKSSAETNQSKEGAAGVALATEGIPGGGRDVMLSHDVCPKGPRLRRASLPSGKGTVVIVTEVLTPWYFYVQQISTEFKRLMEEICYFMQTTGMSSAGIKNVSVGMMCLAPYPKDNVYYRAVIVKVIDNSQDADIMFIDYGDQTRMQTCKLRTIPERFTDVPAQAICCALAGVMPSNKYCIWTEADVMYFSQYVRNQQLSCFPVCCSCDPTFPHIVELILHFPMSVIGQEQMIMSSQINLSVLFLSKKSVQKIAVSEQMSKVGKSPEVTRNAEVKMLLEQILMQDSKRYNGSCNLDHQRKIREIDETEATGTILRLAAEKTVSCVVVDSLAKMSDSTNMINESKSLESNTPIKIEEDKTFKVERLFASNTPVKEETFSPAKDKNGEVAVMKWKENHSERQELKDVYKKQQGLTINSILENSQDKNIQKASEVTNNKSVHHLQGNRLLPFKELGTERTNKMSEVRKPKTEFTLSVDRKKQAKKPKGKGSTRDIKKEPSIQSEVWKVHSSETWKVDNEPTIEIVTPEESQSESKKTMLNRGLAEEQLSKKEVSSSELVGDKAQDEDSGLEGDSMVDTETGKNLKYRERPDSRHGACIKSSNIDASRCPLFRDGSEMKDSTGCDFTTIKSVETLKETNVDGEPGSHDKTEDVDSETADSITSSDSAKISTGVTSSKDHEELMFSSDVGAKVSVNAQRYEVMMSHINSPSDFYVHLVSWQTGQTIERIMSGLKKHYGDMKKKKLQKLAKSFTLEKEKLCCVQYPVDGSFYRAKIIDICQSNATNENNPNIGKAHLFYLDFGNDEWLPKKMIFPLPEEFALIPQLTIHCSLAYIKPMSDHLHSETVCAKSSSIVWTWSKEDRDLFVQLTGCEKKLLMHVVHGSLSGDISGELLTNSGSSPVKVLLVNNSEDEEVCLNMDLIRLGRATLDLNHLPLEKSAHEEDQQSNKSWNPMAEDFFAIRNSYQVDTNDPGVATVGYKANDERVICKFFSMKTPGKCFRGDSCPYKHVEFTRAVTQDKKEVFASVHESQLEIMPEVGSWIAVEVTTILNPGHFYINLPFGKKSLDGKHSCSTSEDGYGSFMEDTETLADLMEAMNEHYSKKSFFEGDLIYRAPGEIVAAKFSQDGQWYRARVISVNESKVKVFYLDFGNTEKVDRKDIYEMQPQFMLLPFQAVECFLYNAEPASNQESWSQDAMKYFRELVDGKTLVAYVPCSTRERLLLILYDTTTDDDIDIGEALIQRGYAQPRQAPSSDPPSSRSSSSSIILTPG
ncbi:hypothetical protein CHS0354_021741 [Potamilus streckersoni]|uniref:Uncharacterized protein n=1 Tax=Potamilus streckersoni TaxID=2493646 RepID=A0AAE0TKM8_9BIVA|nr:hypothetical protein CHS0354_021741 [Potamilus streckersoni]